MRLLEGVAKKHKFALDVPVKDLTPAQLNVVLYGDPEPVRVSYRGGGGHSHNWDTRFEGVVTNMTP